VPLPDDPHRLPSTVRPTAYRLLVDSDLAAGTFSGTVAVEVEVREATDVIVCNAVDLAVERAQLVRDGEVVDLAVTVEGDTERIRLRAPAQLSPGPATLRIEYDGRISDQLEGFYRSTFEGPDGPELLGVTQFEAPHARRAFPCWDEPALKATFEISLVCDAGLLAVSNAAEAARRELPDGRVRFDFAPTIPMSTYLVAWVIGRFETTAAGPDAPLPIRVIHRPGQAHLATFALDCAAHAVRWFEGYYGIEFPGEKLDLVAVPDFSFGAMENLGCITFRENLLLVDVDSASQLEIEQAAIVIDHEIAHMWFGDLVTMAWWDGLWLNEAFATFMEIRCPDDYRPEWDLWTSFALTICPAFDTDALHATRAIQAPVASPDDIEGMFDVLTYEKGAAVLRMVERWAGEETFRSGVRAYLEEHRYGSTEADDLWRALGEVTGVDVGAVLSTWIAAGGHPLVEAHPTDRGVRLRQRRFTYLPAPEGAAPSDGVQAVPVRLAARVGDELVEREVLLGGAELDVDLGGRPSALTANRGGTGFYRTAVEGLHPLFEGPTSLSATERLTAVDNAAALFLAGERDLEQLLALVRTVAAAEQHPQVWRCVADVVVHLAQLRPNEVAPIVALVDELVGDRLEGWLDGVGPAGADRRQAETAAVVFRLAGLRGQRPEVVAASRTLAQALAHRPASVHPELAGPVLEVFAAHGGADDFELVERLWQEAPTPQEELRAQAALAAFRDPALARRFLEMCRTRLRPHTMPRGLSAAMANPATGVDAWRFVAEHWDELTARAPSSGHAAIAGGIRSFSDPELVAEIEAFFARHPISQAQLTLAQHLERARVNVAARRRIDAGAAGARA